MRLREGCLYGAIPPFTWYCDYIGKPLYRMAREIGLPKLGAIAVAGLPVSVFHTSGIKDDTDAVLLLIASEILCTGFIYGVHRLYTISRRIQFGSTEENVPTIDDLVKKI